MSGSSDPMVGPVAFTIDERKAIKALRKITGSKLDDQELYGALHRENWNVDHAAGYIGGFEPSARSSGRRPMGTCGRGRGRMGGRGRGRRGDGGRGGRNLPIPSAERTQASRGSTVAPPHSAANQYTGKSGQHQISVPGVESNLLSEPLQLSSASPLNSSLALSSSCISQPSQDVSKTVNITEVSKSEAHVQSTELKQDVTFPKHFQFQVPKALNYIKFGSLTFGNNERLQVICDNSNSPTPESYPGNNESVNSRGSTVAPHSAANQYTGKSGQHQISVPGIESNLLSEPLQLSSASPLNSSLALSSSCVSQPSQDVSKTVNITEVSKAEAHVQSTELKQDVTFPKNFQFQVSKALNDIRFGSFTFGNNERLCGNSNSPTPESYPGNNESVNSSNKSAPLTEHGGRLDHAHSSSYLVKKEPASEGISVTSKDSTVEQLKQESEGSAVLTQAPGQNISSNSRQNLSGNRKST